MNITQLKAQQAALFKQLAMDVIYHPFVADAGNINDVTGEIIDDEAAYPTSVTLKALIDYSPNEATRHALGLKQEVDVILSLLVADCESAGIIITTKDRFQIQGSIYYVVKVAPNQQIGDEFLSHAVALTRTAGGRRNR